MRFVIFLLVLLTATGCPVNETLVPLGPSFDQRTVASGSTNIDPAEGIQFELSNTFGQRIPELVEAFGASSSFHDRSGMQVSAAVASRDPSFVDPPLLTVMPTGPLAADSWYEFRPGVATSPLSASSIASGDSVAA